MYCRPLIISIEDDRDYLADLVLATLLDDSTPLNPTQTTSAAETSLHPSQTTSAGASLSSVPTTTADDSAQRLAQPVATSAHRQLGQTAAWRREEAAAVFDKEEGDSFRDTREPGTSRDPGTSTEPGTSREPGTSTELGASREGAGGNTKTGRSSVLPTCSSGPSVLFPSGSQFRQTHSTAPSRAPTGRTHTGASALPRVSHIPRPPQDVELMETDVVSEPGGSNVAAAAARVDLGMDDDDVMDALFGEDDVDGGVAQRGDMFGFNGTHKGVRMQPLEEGVHSTHRIQPLEEGKER